MSVFVSRQLRKDERTRSRNEVGEEVGAPSAAVGVVLSSYGISTTVEVCK